MARRQRKQRRADDETIALAAHELQSPLAAIESYLELMSSESPEGTKDMRLWLEDVRHMKSTTSHLRRTIGDILDMTRVEDGRMKLTLRPVDANALITEAVAAFGAHAKARRIALQSSVPAGLGPVLADPDRVRQVLDNLIGNALKHTPSERTVTVVARAAGSRLTLAVEDEGAGRARRARKIGTRSCAPWRGRRTRRPLP
jgi:signal transduction histidine kinase